MRSLYRISAGGGTSEKVLANVPPQFQLSPDGRSVTYLTSGHGDERYALVVRSIDGSSEKVIATLPQGAALLRPGLVS